ncbi:MAG: sigma-70 family RNA polymerase sigma factor [Alphaproteobacteria bacterium]|nr:sigma-70 family RNA polymerase sigma factor [Alphaproteobacteria bacterium]
MNHPVAAGLRANIKSLRRYAMALTRDPNDADDLVQECLKRALTYIKDGKDIENFRAYLFTILHNIHNDELTRRKKKGIQIPFEKEGIRLVYPPPQYSYMDCKDLLDALDKLPDEQRQVVLLIGLEGMSYRGASDVLGVPLGTVMSRLSRGRNALRILLAGGLAADRGPGAAPRRRAVETWHEERRTANVG